MLPCQASGPDARGDLSDAYFSTAQQVPGLRNVLELRSGANHTCARSRSGAVWCWGANDQGQIGDGSFKTRYEPVMVLPTMP